MSLTIDHVDGVARATLDIPPLNTLDLEAILALEAYFGGLPDNIPLVIQGRGEAFSAGVDTKAFAAYEPWQQKEMILAITRMTAALMAVESPIVAAVNGHALGGGFVLMLCADYRIAADGTGHKHGLSEAKAGVPFPIGPAEIIRHELPQPLLRQLTLSSRSVPASCLHDYAVFDELAPVDELAERAVARATELAAQPAFTIVKKQVRGGLAGRLADLASVGVDPLTDYLGI